MKIATFLLTYFFISIEGMYINNPQDEMRQTTDCMKQSRVKLESLKNIYLEGGEPEIKEYLFCMSKNAGYQDENGHFQMDVIRRRLKSGYYSDDTIDEVMERCTKHSSTPQETAYHFMKCVYDNTIGKKFS